MPPTPETDQTALKVTLRRVVRNFQPNGRRYHELTEGEKLDYLASEAKQSRQDIEALLDKEDNALFKSHVLRTSPMLDLSIRHQPERIRLDSQPF